MVATKNLSHTLCFLCLLGVRSCEIHHASIKWLLNLMTAFNRKSLAVLFSLNILLFTHNMV